MGILFAFLSALSFATTSLLISKGAESQRTKASGYLTTVIMNVVILGVISGASRLIQDDLPAFSSLAIFYFVLSGLLTTGLGRYYFFSSIGSIGPSRASAVKNSSPLFTIVFAIFALHESFNLVTSAGVTLVMAGILLISWKSFRQAGASFNLKNVGYILGIAAAVFFGVGQGVRKLGLAEMDDAFLGAWVGALTSFLLLAAYEWGKGNLKAMIQNSRDLARNPYFVGAGALNSLGPLFFFLGASYSPVSIVSALVAVEPILTIILSRVFFHRMEDLPLVVWVAAILVFSGTCLIMFL